MARSLPRSWEPSLLAILFGGGLLFALLPPAFRNESGASFALAVSVAVFWGLPVLVPAVLDSRAYRRASEKVLAVADQHMTTLIRRRAQLLTTDSYGTTQADRWSKEIEYFIRTQVSESLTQREHLAATKRRRQLIALIETRVASASAGNPDSLNISIDQMTPSEFEKHCAERLQRIGWSARATGASGDQGVDVVAEKGSTRVVLQCKLYSKPIGNKAVQEAVAGRSHYGARFAVVVSNNSYTPSADQLAKTNGVLLLHYTQLDDLDRLLGVEEQGPSTASIFPDAVVPTR